MTDSQPTVLRRWVAARRRKGRLAALIIAAVAVSMVIPVAAQETGGFSDVRAGGVHTPAIHALAEQGVFTDTECGEGRFCPDDPIERSVMAIWLIRVLDGEITTTGSSRFADVDASEWWSPYAEELADREITTGCRTQPLSYCPDQPVTRAQMATFLFRAFNLAPAPAAGFADTGNSFHRANIDALAAAGITTGCRAQPLSYCPDQSVTRAQMAAFLHRALLRQKEQAPEISDDVPDVDLVDISSGEMVNLRSAFTGDKGVLLWFWAEW